MLVGFVTASIEGPTTRMADPSSGPPPCSRVGNFSDREWGISEIRSNELVPSERGLWTVEVYEDADGTQPFASWLNRLSEAKFVALDAAIRLVLSERGLDLARTEWLKPLGEGLHEFRVRHDADEIEQMFGDLESRVRPRQPILLRVFVHFHGSRIVLLLGGYDKGRDPSDKRQEREIKRARKSLEDWRRQEKARKKAR